MANYNPPWNKGKTGVYSNKTLKKMSDAAKKRTGEKSPMFGKNHSDESKRKISISKLGKQYNLSEEQLKIKSEKMKGKNNPFYGKQHSKETRIKMSKIQKEYFQHNKSSMLGKKHTVEAKLKMSRSHTGFKHTEEAKQKMSNYLKGRKFSNEHKNKMSESKKGKNNSMYGRTREKAPRWLGGISFEPYSADFNKQFKKLIRERDGYKCQICGMPEIENNENLSCRHMDYDKKNNLPDNLISLCRVCHMKTNFNRDNWIKFFKELKLKRFVA